LPADIELYLALEKAQALRALGNSYKLPFIPYDWDLNDQKT
jgi:hypothetical protein